MVLIPGKIQQQVDQFIPHHRIQTAGGLVQKQQLRMVSQCNGKPLFHLHAAGIVFEFFLLRQGKSSA